MNPEDVNNRKQMTSAQFQALLTIGIEVKP
jgi:hypothetical protein